MNKPEQLDAKFDNWIENKISVLCFDHKNPFTDEEIKSWSLETAMWIIHVITPDTLLKSKEHEKLCDQVIIRIKDLHGIF